MITDCIIPEGVKMIVEDWTNKWIDVYIKNSVKYRTYEKYRQVISSHILPSIGQREMDDIKAHDIQRLIYVDLLEGKGLKGSTVNIVLAVLKSMFQSAEDAEIINRNPCSRVKRVAVEEKKIKVFTKREQEILEYGVKQDGRCRMYGIIICLYTGLRIGELLALTWSDIDFVHNTITVNKTSAPTGIEKGYSTPKTKASVRILPIPPNILPILRVMKKQSTCKWVVEYKGKQVSERSYQGLFERLQRRLGIQPRGFHALRHTFATRAMECGTDYKTLSELMGHSNAMITINRYAHSLMETKRKAMNRIAKIER